MLGGVSRFSTEKSCKIEKVHLFQEKNASNKFNISSLNKIEEDFLR